MQTVRPPRLRRATTALATGLAALLLVSSSSLTAAAPTLAAGSRGDPKPTIVLVHGAFADSSGWNAVASRLMGTGYPVIAFSNPLRGPLEDAAYLRDFLGTIEGPVVLVGHSYGGAVITNAATGDPDVTALVYVAAYAPDEGESVAAANTSAAATPRSPTTSCCGRSRVGQAATPTPTSTRPTSTGSSPRTWGAAPPR
jgi:pimeloyl-ACP methyl ester carboxylesterase